MTDSMEDKDGQLPECKCVFCGRIWPTRECKMVCPACENSADPRVKVPDAMKLYTQDDLAAACELVRAAPRMALQLRINEMVDRFLSWPLPNSVCSDPCAITQGYPNRSGTNLLTAVEARAMLEHVLEPALKSEWLTPKAPVSSCADITDADDVMLQKEFDGFAAVVLFKGHSAESKARAEWLVTKLRSALPECAPSTNAAGQGNVETVQAQDTLPAIQPSADVRVPTSPPAPAAPSEGPTPRTDSEVLGGEINGMFVVDADFARQLERELADQTEAADASAKECDRLQGELARSAIEEPGDARELRFQAAARSAVVHELFKINPNFMHNSNTGQQCAIDEIRRLAALSSIPDIERTITTVQAPNGGPVAAPCAISGCALMSGEAVHVLSSAAPAGIEEAYNMIMGMLRDTTMQHGICQPREDRACTHCNAVDDLKKLASQWAGPRAALSATAPRGES